MVRVIDGRNVDVSFVISKARVAPFKFLAVPRLELQGAVVGLRLALLTCKALNLHISDMTFWTDSMTVFQWIRSKDCRFHTFVANRIGEILEDTRSSQWRHIPGRLNPADVCSRGIAPEKLSADHLWFTGPPLLKDPEALWPDTPVLKKPDAEIMKAATPYVGATQSEGLCSKFHRERCEFLSRFFQSTWNKAVPTFFKARNSSEDTMKCMLLLPEEIEITSWILMKMAQEAMYTVEISAILLGNPVNVSSSILNLSPFLDDHGILRVGGRLGRAKLAYDTKHPIILPRHHQLTRLIILHYHWIWWHASSERTLAQLRQKFWIPGGRAVINSAI